MNHVKSLPLRSLLSLFWLALLLAFASPAHANTITGIVYCNLSSADA